MDPRTYCPRCKMETIVFDQNKSLYRCTKCQKLYFEEALTEFSHPIQEKKPSSPSTEQPEGSQIPLSQQTKKIQEPTPKTKYTKKIHRPKLIKPDYELVRLAKERKKLAQELEKAKEQITKAVQKKNAEFFKNTPQMQSEEDYPRLQETFEELTKETTLEMPKTFEEQLYSYTREELQALSRKQKEACQAQAERIENMEKASTQSYFSFSKKKKKEQRTLQEMQKQFKLIRARLREMPIE